MLHCSSACWSRDPIDHVAGLSWDVQGCLDRQIASVSEVGPMWVVSKWLPLKATGERMRMQTMSDRFCIGSRIALLCHCRVVKHFLHENRANGFHELMLENTCSEVTCDPSSAQLDREDLHAVYNLGEVYQHSPMARMESSGTRYRGRWARHRHRSPVAKKPSRT